MMSYTARNLSGVGGWLAFFLVTLAIFTPLGAGTALVRTLLAEPVSTDWAAIRAIYTIGNGAIIVIAWVVTWFLVRVRRWKSVRIAVAGLWTAAIFPHAFEVIGTSLVVGQSIGRLAAAWGLGLFQPLLYSVIWTAYLLRSKRIANTYPRDGDEEEIAAVFE